MEPFLAQVAVSKGDKLDAKLCVLLLSGHLLWWLAQPVDMKPVSTAGKWQRRPEATLVVTLVGLATLFVDALLDEWLHTLQVSLQSVTSPCITFFYLSL